MDDHRYKASINDSLNLDLIASSDVRQKPYSLLHNTLHTLSDSGKISHLDTQWRLVGVSALNSFCISISLAESKKGTGRVKNLLKFTQSSLFLGHSA